MVNLPQVGPSIDREFGPRSHREPSGEIFKFPSSGRATAYSSCRVRALPRLIWFLLERTNTKPKNATINIGKSRIIHYFVRTPRTGMAAGPRAGRRIKDENHSRTLASPTSTMTDVNRGDVISRQT